jgi:hypothetical protein
MASTSEESAYFQSLTSFLEGEAKRFRLWFTELSQFAEGEDNEEPIRSSCSMVCRRVSHRLRCASVRRRKGGYLLAYRCSGLPGHGNDARPRAGVRAADAVSRYGCQGKS